MAGYERQERGRQLPFDDMQVCKANPAGSYLNHQLMRHNCGPGNFFQMERICLDGCRLV
jgi:hypothetical protein